MARGGRPGPGRELLALVGAERAAFFVVGQETIAFRDHARFVGRLGANDRHSRFMDPRVGGDLRLW